MPDTQSATGTQDIARIARETLEKEAQAIAAFAAEEDGSLPEAVDLLHETAGPVIVAGLGKSGHIARKIAATFRSLGKPAHYLHPAEASHGDLGIVEPGSVVLVLSNSGATSELSDLLHYCTDTQTPVIGLTANRDSPLARASRVVIAYGAQAEACMNGLAPTTSTTVSLAVGDALAIGLSARIGTAPEDFRRFHPGGQLGARLMRIDQVMRTGDRIPVVAPEISMTEAVVTMSEKALGTALVVRDQRAVAVVTDGDMRRNISRLWSSRAIDIATPEPFRLPPDSLVADAVEAMNARAITVCVVEDDRGCLAGIAHLHDCLSALGGSA